MILFIVSLLLLITFFSIKIWETRSGQKLFLSDFRSRADRVITNSVRSVSAYTKKQADEVSTYTADTVTQFRNSFSGWLEDMAEKIRS